MVVHRILLATIMDCRAVQEEVRAVLRKEGHNLVDQAQLDKEIQVAIVPVLHLSVRVVVVALFQQVAMGQQR